LADADDGIRRKLKSLPLALTSRHKLLGGDKTDERLAFLKLSAILYFCFKIPP